VACFGAPPSKLFLVGAQFAWELRLTQKFWNSNKSSFSFLAHYLNKFSGFLLILAAEFPSSIYFAQAQH
jgi:hypothetical protein